MKERYFLFYLLARPRLELGGLLQVSCCEGKEDILFLIARPRLELGGITLLT